MGPCFVGGLIMVLSRVYKDSELVHPGGRSVWLPLPVSWLVGSPALLLKLWPPEQALGPQLSYEFGRLAGKLHFMKLPREPTGNFYSRLPVWGLGINISSFLQPASQQLSVHCTGRSPSQSKFDRPGPWCFGVCLLGVCTV